MELIRINSSQNVRKSIKLVTSNTDVFSMDPATRLPLILVGDFSKNILTAAKAFDIAYMHPLKSFFEIKSFGIPQSLN